MAIKFNVIQRGEPGVRGGGQKKYYARVNTTGEITLQGLTNRIEKISTVNGADIRAVVYGMVEVMIDTLADGQIVRLGELGSLRVSISSKGKDKAEDVNSKSVSRARVIFTPGQEIKDMLLNLKYVRASR